MYGCYKRGQSNKQLVEYKYEQNYRAAGGGWSCPLANHIYKTACFGVWRWRIFPKLRPKLRGSGSPREARLINTGVSSLRGSLLIKTHAAVVMWWLCTHNMPNSVQKSVNLTLQFTMWNISSAVITVWPGLWPVSHLVMSVIREIPTKLSLFDYFSHSRL